MRYWLIAILLFTWACSSLTTDDPPGAPASTAPEVQAKSSNTTPPPPTPIDPKNNGNPAVAANVQADKTSSKIEKLQQLKKYAGGVSKGMVIDHYGNPTLVLKGIPDNVSMGTVPSPIGTVACQDEARALRKDSQWWHFEGTDPIAIQFTRISADIWRYDEKQDCLVSYLVWEGLHQESKAKETLNMWYIFSSNRNPDITGNKLSTKNLSKKEVSSSPHQVNDVFSQQVDLFGSGKQETLQISPKNVVVQNKTGKTLLQHSFDYSDEDLTFGDYRSTLINAATILKNSRGHTFVRVSSFSPTEGGEVQEQNTKHRVFRLFRTKPAKRIAWKNIGIGERDMSENEAGETIEFYDFRTAVRHFATSTGDMVHHIQKKKIVKWTPTCKSINDKKCKGTHERVTEWIFQSQDPNIKKKRGRLFKLDWSTKI